MLSNGSMKMRVQEANGCSRQQWWTQSDDYNLHGALWDNWPKNLNEGEFIIFIESAKNQKSPLYLWNLVGISIFMQYKQYKS